MIVESVLELLHCRNVLAWKSIGSVGYEEASLDRNQQRLQTTVINVTSCVPFQLLHHR